MAKLSHLTKNSSKIKDKPRVYFTCHPDDFDAYFKRITDDLFRSHDCVIYYTEDMNDVFTETEQNTDLERMNLFVVPVTKKLLTDANRAMDSDVRLAMSKFIPILPIMMEDGIDKLYSKPDKFGQLQYLNPNSNDSTEIPYHDKLRRFLDQVLINDELISRVRNAFKTYIFLSYRKIDRQYANDFMRLVHSSPDMLGVAIWFDEFLTPGEDFRENIGKALKGCDLFTLLVTPNILKDSGGKPNFVITDEYPMAKKYGIEVFPVEMVETDKEQLSKKFDGIPCCVSIENPEDFHRQLIKALPTLPFSDGTIEEAFLLGVAYLDGIDVETNREKAVIIIRDCAEKECEEAIRAMISIYINGKGVPKSYFQAQKWYNRLFELKKKDLSDVDKQIALMKVYDEYCVFLAKYFILEYSIFVEETMLPTIRSFTQNRDVVGPGWSDIHFWLCQSYFRSVEASMMRDCDNSYAPLYKRVIESHMKQVKDAEQLEIIKDNLKYIEKAVTFWEDFAAYHETVSESKESSKDEPSIESLLLKFDLCKSDYELLPSDSNYFIFIEIYEKLIDYYHKTQNYQSEYIYTMTFLDLKVEKYISDPDILEGAEILYLYSELVDLLVKENLINEAIHALIKEMEFIEYIICIGYDHIKNDYVDAMELLIKLYYVIGDAENAKEALIKLQNIKVNNE